MSFSAFGKKKVHFLNADEAFIKLARWCAYQERCYADLESRLAEEPYLTTTEKITITERLREENYLNEARFVEAYIRGKFELKKWGVKKIVQGLKQRDIPKSLYEPALKTLIDRELYQQQLEYLLAKKLTEVSKKSSNIFQRKSKLQAYALQKGYEFEAINIAFENLFTK